MGGGKPENPEKNPRSKNENQQQTQPTYDTGTGNRTRATLVGGECSHHCAIPAPLNEVPVYDVFHRHRLIVSVIFINCHFGTNIYHIYFTTYHNNLNNYHNLSYLSIQTYQVAMGRSLYCMIGTAHLVQHTASHYTAVGGAYTVDT